ncbi:MAG: hypothetical protein ACHQIG_04775 [Acidimicrobiia bacterium]
MIVTQGGPDDGFVAIELVAGLGLLLLPVAVLVFTLPTWSERQSGARAIAREVARETARSGVCDPAPAVELAAEMARNLGMPPDAASIALACRAGTVLEPGTDVEVGVTVRMPAVHLPAIGDVASWSWTARHRQPVDTYGALP